MLYCFIQAHTYAFGCKQDAVLELDPHSKVFKDLQANVAQYETRMVEQDSERKEMQSRERKEKQARDCKAKEDRALEVARKYTHDSKRRPPVRTKTVNQQSHKTGDSKDLKKPATDLEDPGMGSIE